MNRHFHFKGTIGATVSVLLILLVIATHQTIPPILAAPEAESMEKWVISSGGGTAGVGGIEISDVLGQPVIDQFNTIDVILESGFRTSTDFPTAVDVTGFTVTAPARSTVVITWETFFEVNLIGFNLYRSTSRDGSFTCITPEPIPAQGMGGMIGTVYTYSDVGLQPGERYVYILEALHTEQPATRYDAMEVIVSTDFLYLPLIERQGTAAITR